MGTQIIYNDKIISFRCDKKRKCSKDFCEPGWCEHTTDLEHALFDGEKTFEPRGDSYWEET